jgi:phosphate starvation-inducible PhoH-like protein|tara:strand:- start:4184 stop:5221 length:1038 start_codon:yes stop_codon:yes gene_type:complete
VKFKKNQRQPELRNIARKNLKSELKFLYSNNTLSIIFQNNELLLGVVGEFNNNLKELENITQTKIYSRGNSILVKSDAKKNNLVKNAIQFLTEQFLNNGTIEKKDIVSSVNKFMIKEKINNLEKNIEYIIKTPKKSVIPRSEKQKDYVRALKESEIIISAGPAGTGKTFLAVAVALTMLLDKKIERIILSRPAVEAGERLGFLPGDMREKVDPYLRPLYDSLYDLLDFEKIQKKIEVGDIEIAPLAFMRGRTLKNSFAILDEAQNATDTQIKMFLTRIGENSKIVINGDPSQIDLPNKSLSGLNHSKKLLGHLKEISVVDFDHNDVVRHPLVSKIVKAYSDQHKN